MNAQRRGRTLRTAPWRRAPLLLVRQPVVVLALALAAAVLGVAAASGPLFLSEVGTASVHDEASEHCAELAMPSSSVGVQRTGGYPATPYTRGTNDAIGRRVAAAYTERDLPAPQNVLLGHATISATVSGQSRFPQYATTFWRPGALDHVRKTVSVGGSGIWLTTYSATQLGVRPGQRVFVNGGSVRVVGLYQRLDDPLNPTHDLARYWCTWHDLITQSITTNSSPAFALATGPDIVIDNAASLNSAWYARVAVQHDTLGEATTQARHGEAAGRQVQKVMNPEDNFYVSTTFSDTTDRAHHIRNGISGAITPIAAGGVVVAMLLVAGAGLFWTIRRRREVRLLLSRGAGPGQLGTKAALETLPWILLGGAVGYAATLVLVRRLGPSSMLEPGAPVSAAGAIAIVCVVAVGLIAAIAASSSRGTTTRGLGVPSWTRRVPWELGLIAAAALAYYATHGSGIVVDDKVTVQLRPELLAFPLLGLTGVLLLITRLLRRGTPLLRRAAEHRRTATFLAWSRIAAAPTAALGLVVGVALPCSILVYSAGLEDSLHSSVQAKYETNIGAPHVFRAVAPGATTFRLGNGAGTQVSVVEEEPQANGETVQILGLDPATFARYAYVDGDQRSAVDRLATAARDGQVQAIVVNNDTGSAIRSVKILQDRLALHVIATTGAFPGLRNPSQPLIVVNRTALAHIPEHVERSEQLWTDDAARTAGLTALQRAGIPILFELDPQVLIGDTGLRPVTWILDYLRALAVLIGLVAVTGVIFWLGARASQQTVAYIMASRMGVARGSQLASLIAELTLLIGLGWLLGTSLAEGAVGAVYRLLDTLPAFPPAPTFVIDALVVVALGVIAVLVALASAAFAQVLALRVRPSDAMRAP